MDNVPEFPGDVLSDTGWFRSWQQKALNDGGNNFKEVQCSNEQVCPGELRRSDSVPS